MRLSYRGILLSGSAMTAAERAKGRFMRAPDGHEGGDTGGSGGDDTGGAEIGASDDFAAFEAHVDAGDKPAAGKEETGQGKPPEGEDAGSGDDDVPDPNAENGEGEDKGKPDPNEERFANLDRQLREEQDRRADLERRLEEATKKPEEKVDDKKARPEGLLEGEPNPEDYEYGEADPSYIKDSSTFHARMEFQRQESERALKTEFEQIEAGYKERVETVREHYPDYDEKVVKGAEGDNPAWVATPVMALAMRTADNGPDVAYHLATNPDESRRIAKLSPLEQAREMGRLEGRFERQKEEAAKPAPKRLSSAPKPPTNVARGAGGKFKVEPDTDDFGSFDKAYS